MVKKAAPKETKESLDQLAEQDAEVSAAQLKERDAHEELDDLLDEIDGLLEEQAVLINFRQKGGQAVRVFIDTVARGFESMFPRRNMRVL